MPEQGVLAVDGNPQSSALTFCFPLESLGLKQALKSMEHIVYLWGEPGCGCTHLLKSIAPRGIYWDLATTHRLPQREAIKQPLCIDNIEAVRGDTAAQQELVGLFDRHKLASQGLFIAGHCPPTEALELSDMNTRLSGGLVYRLRFINDDERINALYLRAKFYQINLPEEVISYILIHCPRDNLSLFNYFDKLCKTSLRESAPLSVSLAKRVSTTRLQGQVSHHR